ncbi:hypothetical protein D043_0596B, partial [Vibrio parahaemolyticus EKP-021]
RGKLGAGEPSKMYWSKSKFVI